MNEQPDLFTPEQGYRRNDRDTSKAAFTNQNPDKLSNRMKLILEFIRQRGASGTTDHDIRMHFGPNDPESSWRKRRSDLTAKGLVIDSGRRAARAGTNVIVWIAAEEAPHD